MPSARKMPTGTQIRRYWADDKRWSEMGVEPPPNIEDKRTCMACGLPGGTTRCHIVPRSRGGPDAIENLHMLCRWCHHASEPLEGEAYWRWIGKQNAFGSIAALFGRYGISMQKILKLVDEEAEKAESISKMIYREQRSPYEMIDRLEDTGIDIRL